MTDLVERLKAAIDEDERIARAALHRPAGGSQGVGEWTIAGHELRDENDTLIIKHTWPREADHIARHDPARVLRQCEAHRAILEDAIAHEAVVDGEFGCCHTADQIAAGLCEERSVDSNPTMQALAAIYGIETEPTPRMGDLFG